MSIAAHLATIRERVHRAASRANSKSESIRLVAISKTFPPEAIREAYNAGQRLFGESKVQEFAEKIGRLSGLKAAEFRMIGYLQSNKAAKAVEIFAGRLAGFWWVHLFRLKLRGSYRSGHPAPGPSN